MSNDLNLNWKKTRVFYSVGHVYNDLCASVWFSYTLLYFKLHFNDTIAGVLLLLGQIADAIATPLIGYISDYNLNIKIYRYGKRKIWHLIGTICVALSFPFIFNSCFWCNNVNDINNNNNTDTNEFWIKFVYYGSLIILFQIGWAAVQVSHVSLITDLTNISSQRVGLNAYRQACTVASSICVYIITLLLLGVAEETIHKKDTIIFTKVVYIITGIGIIFSILFHIFVKENVVKEEQKQNNEREEIQLCNFPDNEQSSLSQNFENKSFLKSENKTTTTTTTIHNKKTMLRAKVMIWSDWLKSFNFWQICTIYMISRLFVNSTQVYTPLYLQDTLRLPKHNIAVVPFITYVTGFIFSIIAKPLTMKIGSKKVMILGCLFGLSSSIWILVGGLKITLWQIVGVATFFGIGGTAMLISSLSLTADLIADNTESGAFVFGTMSFFDKSINGLIIAIVQHFSPILSMSSETYVTLKPLYNSTMTASDYTDTTWTYDNSTIATLNREPIHVLYYLHVLVYVSFGAVMITFLALLTVLKRNYKSENFEKNLNKF